MTVLYAKFNYYLLHFSRDFSRDETNGPNWQYHHPPAVLANSHLKFICLLLESKSPSRLRAKGLSPFIY